MIHKTVSITSAGPKDAEMISELGRKTFEQAFEKLNNEGDFKAYVSQAFSENQILDEIKDRANTFLMARLDGNMAGYAKLSQKDAPDCVNPLPAIELSRLYSVKEFLGLGVGPALLAACINLAAQNGYRSVWLGSWKENSRANAFYKKSGFEIKGSTTFALGRDIQEDHIFVRSLDQELN